jgi:hypothetical protein
MNKKSKQDLVFIQNDDLYVGTWDLAEGFKTEHRHLVRILRKYESEFMEFEEGIKAFRRLQIGKIQVDSQTNNAMIEYR